MSEESISVLEFHDGQIRKFEMQVDWASDTRSAIIEIENRFGKCCTFEFYGLESFCIYEDFGSSAISQCKWLQHEHRVYLSLDPYLENTEEDDRDNYVIIAESIRRKA